jgi:carbamoyltransferase
LCGGVSLIILGITHPISWNNAACILVDGRLIAWVEEERLNRIKHAPRMAPRLAMDYCLKKAGIKLENVDYVAVGYDSAMRAALGNLNSEESLLSGLNQAAMWLRDGITYERKLPLEGYDRSRVIFVNHHHAHAASTFFASGFPEANILSLDGSGGNESGILGVGHGVKIDTFKAISNRGSWGLLYEQITEKLGFRRHSSEGKVMGLAAYGTPDPNGLPFINWDGDIPMIEPESRKIFINSIPARKKEDPITDYHKNLAATLQDTLERAAKRMAEYLYGRTGIRRLCLAGGTALNCSMNGKLALLPFVDEIFIQPAAYDAGTALGAAMMVYVDKVGRWPEWKMEHAFWGPEFTNEEIEEALKAFSNYPYKKSDDISSDAARNLAEGKIVGWFQGRSEVGPRALGNRSILANPSLIEMKERVNNQVKHREPWRPFAPSVLEERIDRYIAPPMLSPFMILAFDVLAERKAEIVAASHIDGTIRPQTVSKATNPRFWNLIKKFEDITGIPAVLNTSFNVDSQPIVNTPEEAIDTFINCGIDVLAIGDFLVWKPETG